VTDREYAIAQDWIEDLKAVGIEATLQHFEQPVWFDKVDNGNFDAGIWWMCGATVDPVELYGQFKSAYAVPIGTRTVKGNAMRLKDPELDAVVAKLESITPDDPAAMDLYMQAYDLFMRDAPGVPLIQTYYTVNYNGQYWDNFPTNKNMYTVPFNWWAQIMWVLFNVKAK
jgi:peptide/nickel transport system substrate-binding protein